MSNKESNVYQILTIIILTIVSIMLTAYILFTIIVLIEQPNQTEHMSLQDVYEQATIYFNMLISILVIFVSGFIIKEALENIACNNVYNQRFHN